MPPEFGYLIKMDESTDFSQPLNALRVGKYLHPVYGEEEITLERLQRFADNVNKRVRGIDLDIDYDHKAMDGKAAGWVKTAEVRDDQLFVTVEWTEAAQKAIKDKEYRYFSPEYMDEWTDSDGNVHQDVLFGGGLTNRPYMKDLMPLNFSEHLDTKNLVYTDPESKTRYLYNEETEKWITLTTPRKGVSLDPKRFAELLGVKTESEDDIFAAVEALKEKADDDRTKAFAEAAGIEGDEAAVIDRIKTLKTFHDEKAGEEEHAKTFAEMYPAEAKRLRELDETNKRLAAEGRVKEWSELGLAPAVDEAVTDFRMGLSDDQAEKFDELMKSTLDAGIIKPKDENGGGNTNVGDDEVKEFKELIESIQKDDEKLSYRDAVRMAEQQKPELAAAYRKAGG